MTVPSLRRRPRLPLVVWLLTTAAAAAPIPSAAAFVIVVNSSPSSSPPRRSQQFSSNKKKKKKKIPLLLRQHPAPDDVEGGGGGDGSLSEIESARRQLEDVIGPAVFSEERCPLEDPSCVEPLTQASRKRRELEIELLRSLEASDDAADALMDLWMVVDCGGDAAADALSLRRMEDECPEGTEEALRGMIARHPGWIEPRNRLALLLFLSGRCGECQLLVRTVLRHRPWHFEALQLQVLLALEFHRDRALALRWARRGLPPLRRRDRSKNSTSRSSRRQRWVEQAVRDATERLLAAISETENRMSSSSPSRASAVGSPNAAAPWQ
jgi:hypothetical protein